MDNTKNKNSDIGVPNIYLTDLEKNHKESKRSH